MSGQGRSDASIFSTDFFVSYCALLKKGKGVVAYSFLVSFVVSIVLYLCVQASVDTGKLFIVVFLWLYYSPRNLVRVHASTHLLGL